MAEREPEDAPVDEMVESEELGDDGKRVDQQNQGVASRGGGEFPDPDTPPSGEHGAPGEPGVSHQEHGGGQFSEAYEAVPDDVAATGSIGRERTEPAD